MPSAPTYPELEALLRLLDDETPEVRAQVALRFNQVPGDLSEWLAGRPEPLTADAERLLSEFLRPARRTSLERNWVVPTGGAGALREDWEILEAILRQLSDFLHDGVTLRQPLSDALDLVAEEASQAGVGSANELRKHLFGSGRLIGDTRDGVYPEHSDLSWSIIHGRSNPIGLGLIFILVGRRLDYEVQGINFPGHFLCRIHEEGYPLIVDCFDQGRLHLQATLLEAGSDLSKRQRELLQLDATPGEILVRVLRNLDKALVDHARTEDSRVVKRLIGTLA